MTPITTINLLRALFVTVAFFIGATVGDSAYGSGAVGAAFGMVFGLVMVLVDRLLKGFTLRTFSAATFGLLLGFLFSRLLLASDVLKYQNEEMRWLMSLATYGASGYIGMMLAMRSNRDEFSVIIPFVRFQGGSTDEGPLVVDTSVIIDGRMPQICAAGFLGGSVVIARFVLDELQQLADSADPIKRERGRRGFEGLAELRANPRIIITVHEAESDPVTPVDTKLVALAKALHARLLTNDSSLGRIAQLQNVPVMKLTALERAMRPLITTGDRLELTLVKEGRDPRQALGYLPDGTMIVVNNGRPHLGKTVSVTVAGAIQTSAGRMFFAELS